jgi:hypothetical protein
MEDEWRERPVDRLHALASAQIVRADRAARASHLAGLGVSIIALKSANRADELSRAIDRLATCLLWRQPSPTEEMAKRIARQAVQECVIDFCPTCHGAGEIPDQDGIDGAQRMKVCPTCGGHGKRRYSNGERIEALQIHPGELHRCNRWIGDALGFISLAEDEAIKTANRLLERW